MGDYTSVSVLFLPENGAKGAMVTTQPDKLVNKFPNLKDRFYIVERTGWYGPCSSESADVKLCEDPEWFLYSASVSPNSICLPVGDADFVDTDVFKPVKTNVEYDIFQIACWKPRKRHDLFLKAARLLPNLRFGLLGHFVHGGTVEELEYRDRIVKSAPDNVKILYADAKTNQPLPDDPVEVNRLINSSQMGVITTHKEGINRFRIECYAANVPVLVASDTKAPTRKFISDATGKMFSPHAEDLASKISECLGKKYSPRKYIVERTGKTHANRALSNALSMLMQRDGIERCIETSFDGRNQSHAWNEDGHCLLETLL